MYFQVGNTWYTSGGVPCKEPCKTDKATFMFSDHDNVQLIHKASGQQVTALR